MKDGPFLKYKDFITNPIIMELEIRRQKETKMLHNLKSMKIQLISKKPDWIDCTYCAFADGDYEKHKDAIFHNLAYHIVFNNKIPLEVAKFKDYIFVRTENQNA